MLAVNQWPHFSHSVSDFQSVTSTHARLASPTERSKSARKFTRLIHRKSQTKETPRSICLVLQAMIVGALCCWVGSGCQTLQTFKDASKTQVVSARNWARSGFEAMHQGRFQQAKTFFSKAASDMPDDYRIMANLARSEFKQGNVDRSISIMEQAVQRSNDPTLRCELGGMYLDTGRWIAANEHAEKAIQRDRHFAPAWKLKGRLASSKSDHQRALQLYQRSLAYEAESDEIQMLIAQTYMRLEQPMRALSATETLLSRHPPELQPEIAIIAKSDALLAMEQHPAAIDILRTASIRPDCSKEIFFQLGKAHVAAGQPRQAQMALARGKRQYPDDELFTQLAAAVTENPAAKFAAPHRVASVKAESLAK